MATKPTEPQVYFSCCDSSSSRVTLLGWNYRSSLEGLALLFLTRRRFTSFSALTEIVVSSLKKLGKVEKTEAAAGGNPSGSELSEQITDDDVAF